MILALPERRGILESEVRRLTVPLNCQYPRPWFTQSAHPESAQVFVVGYNQATGYRVDRVGSHESYLDALFNRNGVGCRQLYDRMRGDKGSSVTRGNLDRLTTALREHGATDVLETNVICYGTPMGADLGRDKHAGGRERGRELFQAILGIVRPPVVIAHGVRANRELSRVLQIAPALQPATTADAVKPTRPRTVLDGSAYGPAVFSIPSLAPPKWSAWQRSAEDIFAALACQIGTILQNPPA